MRYRMNVYYQTDLTKKITEDMRQILGDWGNRSTHLEVCQAFEFETPRPLTEKEKERLLALKKDWMDRLELKEIPKKEKKHGNS